MDEVKKSVTLLISTLSGGGAENVCITIANGMAKKGWNVTLVVLHLERADYLERVSERVNIEVLGVQRARQSIVPILKFIYKNKPEFILAFNYEMTVMLVALKSILRFHTKIISRNVNTFTQKMKAGGALFNRLVINKLIVAFYGKVDYVINQCNAMKDDLISHYPNLETKTSVIYNPVSEYIEDYASANGLNKIEKQDYFLCVGRLNKQKAFHYAIEAFANIVNELPPTFRLKIVGRGELETELKNYARDLGVVDRVDFEGFQKNLIPYYLHARATVLTSLYEGFPNVLIESLTLGTPVVAFNCPSGPSEIITTNKNGFIVEYLNVEDLQNKMTRIVYEEIKLYDIIKSVSKNKSNYVVDQYIKLLSRFV